MCWILDSGQAVGQQHLDVPVAAEVAIALQFMNMLDALMAEIRDGHVRIVCAQIGEDWNGARLLSVNDRFSNNLAARSNATLVARLGGILESSTYFTWHSFLECVWPKFFGAESSTLRMVFQSIFRSDRATGIA